MSEETLIKPKINKAIENLLENLVILEMML